MLLRVKSPTKELSDVGETGVNYKQDSQPKRWTHLPRT